MIDRYQGDATFLYALARDSDVTELVAYMKRSDSPAIRARAAELLGDFSSLPQPEQEEELRRELVETALNDDNEEVRAMAIDALYRHGQDSLERLIDRLSEDDLSDAPDWVIAETLASWLDNDRAEFRLVAATALGDLGDVNIVPDLIGLFSDPDARVRMRAVRSVGQLGDPRAIEPLRNQLTDRRTMVQREAAYALAGMDDERALEALVPVARADDEGLRQIAVEALGRFTNLKPLIVLVQALQDRSPAVKRTAAVALIDLFADAPADTASEMRATIADQLERADSAEVVPPLLDVVRQTDRPHIRRNALWLLPRVTDEKREPTVTDQLLEHLADEDETCAGLAASGLALLAERLTETKIEKKLRVYVQHERGTEQSRNRAEQLIEQLTPDIKRELESKSIDYTYVRTPADYTRKKRQGDEWDG